MHHPELLPSIPPWLSDKLRQRTDELRSNIVRANYKTRFARDASELTDFRYATTGRIAEMDIDGLSDIFRNTVRFTTYDSYAPFLSALSEKPFKASALVDLFAPGLPDCVSESSSTSGGIAKSFFKYNTLSSIRSSGATSQVISNPSRRRTEAHVWYLGVDRMDVLDDHQRPVATTYLVSSSVIGARMYLRLNPEEDDGKMGTFILDHAAPYAAGFIRNWRSFLLINGLFAIGSRSLETMSMGFLSTFVDMIRYVDLEFDMIVDCISRGTIPDLDGIADVRHYLEMNISPDLERASELRRIGRPSSRPGWCADIWPNLCSVTGISSGHFASSIHLARWFIGKNAGIRAHVYACTEGAIGMAYNPLQLNQFKLWAGSVFEFLDVSKCDSIAALAQPWEVELGRQYEVVMTTTDGLWRYRVGDVIEVCGFDPTDGVPVIQFVDRRSAAIRIPDLVVTEKELRAAMSSVAPDMVVNWTAAVDDRQVPPTIGFFVELVADRVPPHTLIPDRLFDELLRLNANIVWAFEHGKLGKSTIRLVNAGTFSDFLQHKLDEGSNNVGQIKVPVALPKAEYVAWFSERVVQEL